MNATDELARLQAAAERAQAGFHHEEAIALYIEAMEIAPLGDDPATLTQRYELLFLRGQSYEWIGKVQSTEARQIFGDLIGEVRQSDSSILPNILAWKAAAHLSLYEIEKAKIASAESVKLLELRSFVGPELQQDDIIIVAVQG